MKPIKCKRCKKKLEIQLTPDYGFVCKDCDTSYSKVPTKERKVVPPNKKYICLPCGRRVSGREVLGYGSLGYRVCYLCRDERDTVHIREFRYPKI